MNENIKDNDNLETPVVKGKRSRDIWDYILAFVAPIFLIVSCFAMYRVGYSNGSSDMYDECTAILDDYVEELEEARSAITTMVVEDEDVDDVVEEVDDVVEEIVEQTTVTVEEEKPDASEYVYYSPAHPDIYLNLYSILPDYVDKDELIDVACTYLERKGYHNADYIHVFNVEDDYVWLGSDQLDYYVDLRSMTIGSDKEVLARGRDRELEYVYKYDEFNLHGDYAEYKMTIDDTCSFDVVGTHCAYDIIRAYRYNRTKDEDADIYEIRLHDFDGQYGIISGSAGDVKFYVADTNFVIQDRRVEYTSDYSYIENWETWN